MSAERGGVEGGVTSERFYTPRLPIRFYTPGKLETVPERAVVIVLQPVVNMFVNFSHLQK